MKTHFKTLALAGAVALGSAAGVSAATIDFTDRSTYSPSPAVGQTTVTGSTNGISWSLSAGGGYLTDFQNFDGDEAGNDFMAFESDGIGVSQDLAGKVDDEVSFGVNGGEYLMLTFTSGPAEIIGAYFLDVFGFEGVKVTFYSTMFGEFFEIFDEARNPLDNAVEEYETATFGGYFAIGGPAIEVTALKFEAIGFNDFNGGVGNPDFALAGIALAPIPLPAGGVLLLTALGGLGLAARRRKA